jgi:hypothetical protein
MISYAGFGDIHHMPRRVKAGPEGHHMAKAEASDEVRGVRAGQRTGDNGTSATMSVAPRGQDGGCALSVEDSDGGRDTEHVRDVVSAVIDLGAIRPALLRGARVFLETVAVPTALLYVILHLVGLGAGLGAVVAWCCLTVGARRLLGHPLPGTLLLCSAMLCGRAIVALLLSSAVAFLVQPIIGSILMAGLFLGSAAIGRPITVRLARDFVALPAHFFHKRAVRRVFTEVALIWGVSRLCDAGMSIWFIGGGIDLGLLSRGVFSTLLTVATVALCAGWGWRKMRSIPGIDLRIGGAAPVA